jgi:NAD(P)-dependent dehydrogenase (short-subunit alcohol dehydrogenase family)
MAERAGGRLAGRAALVIGAGSSGPGWGNGKAVAVLFAQHGARVACLDRDAAAASETADLIAGEGGTALALAADVGDEAGLAEAVAAAEQAHGPADILHYNVGIARLGGAADQAEADWQAVLDANLTGLYRAVRCVVPGMAARRRGVVLAVSSIAAIRWMGMKYAAYAASKAAVTQYIRHLALEYARQGIRANAILPGLMRTPMVEAQLAGHYGADREAMIAARDAACPMGHMGDAWDVAHAALFLASEEARYITGTELIVDGGLTASAGYG